MQGILTENELKDLINSTISHSTCFRSRKTNFFEARNNPTHLSTDPTNPFTLVDFIKYYHVTENSCLTNVLTKVIIE